MYLAALVEDKAKHYIKQLHPQLKHNFWSSFHYCKGFCFNTLIHNFSSFKDNKASHLWIHIQCSSKPFPGQRHSEVKCKDHNLLQLFIPTNSIRINLD